MATTNPAILEAIEELRTERGFSAHSDDALFVAIAAKFRFWDGDYSPKKFSLHYTNGPGDGGIDALFVDPSDQTTDSRIILIQGKYSTDYADPREFKKEIVEAVKAIKDLREERSSTYHKKLRSAFSNATDELGSGQIYYHYAFCIANTLTPSQKNSITKALEDLLDKENQIASQGDEPYAFEFSIHDGAAIVAAIEQVNSPKSWVDTASITINLQDRFLEFSEGENLRGFVYNTSSKEIKSLFEKFGDGGGLYAQNNRLFVKSKKIDDKIRNSITGNSNKFWFLNNGILIVCKQAILSGYKLTLDKFSIVNGCQTSTLIGGVDNIPDFRVMLKVIEIDDEELWTSFVGEIAEASNSQKPIKDRDLRSNDPRQAALKRAFERNDPPIFLDIKRGVSTRKKKNLQDWQFTSNEKYAQSLASFLFQMPGTGRNRKADIFGSDELYQLLFWRKPDPALGADLLKLAFEIERFIDNHKPADEDSMEALPYMKHCFLAMAGFYLKIKRGLISPDKGFLVNEDAAKKVLCKDDLLGSFLNDSFDEFEEIIEGLLAEFLQIVIDARNKNSSHESFTNYLKLDRNYRGHVLVQFWNSSLGVSLKRKNFDSLYGKLFN